MTRYLKKAFVLLICAGILFFLLRSTTRNLWEQALMEVMGPPLKGLSSIQEGAKAFWQDYFQNLEATKLNRELERKVIELERKNRVLESILKEKGVEPTPLLLEERHPNLWARIVAYEAVPEPTVAILDKGKRHGVKKNMPVVFEDKVIGRIIDTSPNYSKLMFILDPNSALGAMIEATQEKGLLVGTLEGNCELRYIPVSSEVKPGDLVITSGTDGIFPPGLIIGRVAEIQTPKASKWCYIKVKPDAPFNRLGKVMILLMEDELSKILREFQK